MNTYIVIRLNGNKYELWVGTGNSRFDSGIMSKRYSSYDIERVKKQGFKYGNRVEFGQLEWYK